MSLKNIQVGLNLAMDTLASRAKLARNHSGLTQTQASNASGVKQSDISKIERGETLRPVGLLALARAYGVNAHWLDTGDGNMVDDVSQANVSPGPNATGSYPLISEVQAGAWTELCDHFQPGDAAEWLPSTKNLGECGYMLRVTGKSMENPGGRYSFPEGMILHVNPDLGPVPSQFVIVRRESTKEATFKRFVLIDGERYLEAINPDWPKDKKYLKLEPGDAWCGVVVDASLGRLP